MAEPMTPPRPSRREWAAIGGVCAVALGLRLWHLFELAAQDPFFLLPAIDAGVYHEWAMAIAGGDWLGDRVFWAGPLYPYSLGLLYALVGPSIFAAKLVQAVLGAAVCALTWALGRRLFAPPVALAAAAAVAGSEMLIFYGGTLVLVNAVVPLLLASVWLAGLAIDRPTPARFAAAGLCVGLGALARPNLLGLGILCALWAWFALGATTRRRRLGWLAAYAAGALLVIAPVSARNAWVSGDFVLISWAGGPNLYLGNNPDSDGSFRVPRSYPPSTADHPIEQQQVFHAHAEQILGRSLRPSEVSRFWASQALRYVRTHPAEWLRLMRRKLLLMSNQGELWNIRSLELSREFSAVLRLPLLEFRWLAPLALAGLLVTARRWRRLLPLYAVLATVFGTLLVFFVLSRYRAPAIPVLALFAAAGIGEAVQALRRGGRRRAWLWAASLVLGVKVLTLPGPQQDLSIAYYNLGNRYLSAEDWPRAIASYERALAGRPGYLSAWNNLALACEAQGDVARAVELWERILALAEARGLSVYVERATRHLEGLGPRPGSEGGAAPQR